MNEAQTKAATGLRDIARQALKRSSDAENRLGKAMMLVIDLDLEIHYERRNRYFPGPNESAAKVDALIEEIKGVLRGE